MYMDNNDTISVISASFTASVDLRHKLKGFNKCYCIHFLRIKAISIHNLPILSSIVFRKTNIYFSGLEAWPLL